MTPPFPLFDFFCTLHRAGIPIGIDSYRALLRSLQGGFGHDVESLRRVCKALWVMSPDDEHIFNYQFAQIEPELRRNFESARREREARSLEAMADRPDARPEQSSTFPGPEKEYPTADTTDVQESETPQPEELEFDFPEPQPEESAELLQIEDETQAAQVLTAIRVEAQDVEVPLVDTRFVLSGNYLPVTKRQMKQNWRYLRRFVREGPAEELDVEATVMQISRQGFLLKPVLAPRRLNRVELVLLIDQDGSMTPFHALSERLAQTAIRGGRLRKTRVYYFHNCPQECVYHQAAMLTPEALPSLLNRFHAAYTYIMIISDAGAARGWYHEERLTRTVEFLAQLRRYTPHIVWLNPLPRFRWLGTTAGPISRQAPMFELSRRGLDLAISALRRQG